MTSKEVRALDDQYVMHTYGRFPVVIDHGKGATLYDPEGNAYIDLTSGIGVNSLGYGDADWLAAVTAQAGKLAHISNLFYTEPCGAMGKFCQYVSLPEEGGLSALYFSPENR